MHETRQELHVTHTYDTFVFCLQRGYFALCRNMAKRMERYNQNFAKLMKEELQSELWAIDGDKKRGRALKR